MFYRNSIFALCVAALPLSLSATAFAKGKKTPQAMVTATADLKWNEVPGVPQVAIAPVDGDVMKGPGHFFLRYASGFQTPVHHHSADHFGTLISGTLLLTADGKEHKLVPGSFLGFTNKAKHAARCEKGPDCVMFIDTRAKWDSVLEEAPKK